MKRPDSFEMPAFGQVMERGETMRLEEERELKFPEQDRPSYTWNYFPKDVPMFMLRIHEYEKGQPSGEIVNLFAEEIRTFTGYADALLIMDEIMDRMNIPQSSTAKRHLEDGKKGNRKKKPETASGPSSHPSETPMPLYQYWTQDAFRKKGRKASCYIRVMYRQNSSWQGQVITSKGKGIFRSALELLYFLKEAEQGIAADTK